MTFIKAKLDMIERRRKRGHSSLDDDDVEDAWQDDRDSAWEVSRRAWDTKYRKDDALGSGIIHDLARVLFALCTYREGWTKREDDE